MKRILLSLLILFGLQSAALAASCGSYPFTLQNNTTADATQVMANFNTVRNCVINNAAGSGVNTDITSITGLSTPLSQAQGGSAVYIGGTSTGSANAQTVASPSPIGFALTTGFRVTFTAGFTNTGATTLNINSTGATAVRKNGPSGLEALAGGEIVAGNIVEAIYNGTFLVLLSDATASASNGFGPSTTISAATTVDLGTIPSHNASISGSGVSIASFGSSATTTAPVYLIKFVAANTIVYNATSMIVPGTANITTAANDTAVVQYLGSSNWQVLSYSRATGTSVVSPTPMCGATAFTATNNSGTPNTNIDVAAGSYVLINPTGNVPIYGTAASVTINFATTGANALDTGTLTGGPLWYYLYLISDGTTTAGLGSLSATAPTMPGAYVYKCLLGAVSSSSGNIFFRHYQSGNVVDYNLVVGSNTAVYPVIASSTGGTWSSTSPVLAAATVRGSGFCAPAIATDIQINAANSRAGSAISNLAIMPTTMGGGTLTNLGPQGSSGNVWPIWMSTTANAQVSVWLKLSGNSIGWAADAAGAGISCRSFKLPVNAN